MQSAATCAPSEVPASVVCFPQGLSVLTAAVHAAPLAPSELLVLTEYYGLTGFPAPLTNGPDALVGIVSTPSAKQSRRPAGRTTVTKLLESAVAKLSLVLDPLPPELVALSPGPEPDPAHQEWVWTPPVIDRRLTDDEHAALLESAIYASMDLIDRSDMFEGIQTAIHRWGRRHLDLPSPAGLLPRIRQEHRNAATAVLSVTLWEIVNDEDQLQRALSREPVYGFVGLHRFPTGGRITEHSKYGAMASGLTWSEVVLLVDEVANGRDPDGRTADLLIDELLAGTFHEHFTPDQVDTLIWTLGFGLGAIGSWRLLELTRWYANSAELSPATLSLIGWSAHVASLHAHDGLAWRLTALQLRLSERVLSSGTATPAEHMGSRYQAELVRSGIRVRSAERWRLEGSVTQAHRAITDCLAHLQRAHDAIHLTSSNAARQLNKAITIRLRQIEILIVAGRLRADGHPVAGIRGEEESIAGMLERVRRLLDDPDCPLDDQDLGIFRCRLGDIEFELASYQGE